MKLFFLPVALLWLASLSAQTTTVPSATLKTMEGQSVDLADYVGQGHPVIVSLWATWCKPCLQELDAIAEIYSEWQEEWQVELLAISVDDPRQAAKIAPLVSTRQWPYRILHDAGQQLRRSLQYNSIPQVYLLDAQGRIVYEHAGYTPGSEYELEDQLLRLQK